MAVISTTRDVVSVFKGIRGLGLFGGGSGKDRRRKKRLRLEELGFTLVENGPDWNMDSYYDQGLDNLAQLYQQYGQDAVDLHNSRKIINNDVASNYASLEQMIIAQKERKRESAGVSGFISEATGNGKLINAGAGIVTALAIAGGLFFVISKE